MRTIGWFVVCLSAFGLVLSGFAQQWLDVPLNAVALLLTVYTLEDRARRGAS